jgi:phthalate 4,5-dioxygenase reductase component
LRISAPINNFSLRDAPRYLLIAGGIGITPIRSMLHELLENGRVGVDVLYLTRRKQDAAYLSEMSAMPGANVTAHHSDSSGRMDLWPFLADPDGRHVYCCGSPALMDEVRTLTMHWNPRAVNFEAFSGVSSATPGNAPFSAVWSPTGESFEVPAGTSLLDALRSRAIDVDSSCNSGTCGTCKLRVVSGVPLHRDLVLDGVERTMAIIPCVSRAYSTLEIAPF